MCQALYIYYFKLLQPPCRVSLLLSPEKTESQRDSVSSPVLQNSYQVGHDVPQVFLTLTHNLHYSPVIRDYGYYHFKNEFKLEIEIMEVAMSSFRIRSVSLELHIYFCQVLDSLQKVSRKGKMCNVLQHLSQAWVSCSFTGISLGKKLSYCHILSTSKDGKAWGGK